MNYLKPKLRDVIGAFKEVSSIVIPPGDYEGEPLNRFANALSEEDYDKYARALGLTVAYTRTFDGDVNTRAIRSLQRNGIDVSLNPSQDDPLRLVGYAGTGEHRIEISDPAMHED